MGQLHDRRRERLPSIIGFGSGQHEQVALGEPDTPNHQLGPGQLGEAAVDDLEGRPPRAVVEQRVRIERRNIDRLVEQVLQGGRRRASGVDPAVECGDERRCAKGPGIAGAARPGQRVQRHAGSLRGHPFRPAPRDGTSSLMIQ
jgi:hypothetical protein